MKNVLFIIAILIKFFFFNQLFSAEKEILQFADYKYDIKIPNEISLNIVGKNYIRYLKQIKLTSQKENLNSKVINSTKKRWVSSEIILDNNSTNKVKVKIHGDWNDHISFPYSSLRVKTKKNYFYQLKEFILFKPVTRNYNAEIFSTILLQNMGFLAPYTKEITLKINDNYPENYLLQEKINKNFLERSNFREGPIIEYDERHRWNSVRLGHNLDDVKYAKIYKLDNETFIENPDKENINPNKLYLILSALTKSSKVKNFSSKENTLFEVALSILNACHGLIDHNRKFYFDGIYQKYLPIYYDGMAFEKNDNFCEEQRITSNTNFFNKYNLIFFERKIESESFKKLIKKNYNKQTLKNDQFEKYWSILYSNFLNFKKIALANEEKVNKKNILIKKNVDNFSLLNPKYPLIYYYIEDNKYFECYKTHNKLYKNIDLVSNNNKSITISEDSHCNQINETKFVKLLKNKIYYTPKYNKEIQIFPTFINKKLMPEAERKFLDISNNSNNILLKNNQIYFLYASKNEKINEISFISKNAGDSTVFFIGELPIIENIIYTEENSKLDKNTKMQSYNITGCINFYNAIAKIKKITINQSSCEDGINIINSNIELNNVIINGALSDGIDMDFSKVKVDNIIANKAKGDCLDLSFGDYSFDNIIAKDCGDKGISVGENSRVFIHNVEIFNNNIGIAIKDSSIVKIKSIIKNEKNNTCLSLYNKKPEFGHGKLIYENINNNCIENSLISENSKMKKTLVYEKN